jgi:hypothetical protein
VVKPTRSGVDESENDDLVPALERVDLTTGEVVSTVTSSSLLACKSEDEISMDETAPCSDDSHVKAPHKSLIEMIGGDDDFDGLD